jgi:hypothetical protein
MVGGDFNMIRYVHEKSSGTDYTIWMDMFNCFINNTAMIEVIRGGSKFTWTNKQESPARSNLHRVLISREWKQKYPKVRVVTLTRIGSDHNPLLLDDGTRSDRKVRAFKFESAWLFQPEFKRKMLEKWPEKGNEEIQDFCKRLKKEMR